MKKLLAIALLAASAQAQAGPFSLENQLKTQKFMRDVGYCQAVVEVARIETNAGNRYATANKMLSIFGSVQGMNAKQALEYCDNILERFYLVNQ